jgi:protein ImuA
MAANVHSKLLFVMRPAQAKAESSPAALRVLVSSQPLGADAPPDTLQLHILKRRGPPLTHALALPARSARLGALLALSGGDGEGRNKEGGDALDRLAAAA